MVQKDGTLLLDDSKPEPRMRTFDDDNRSERGERGDRRERKPFPTAEAAPLREFPDMAMVRFRVAVGRKDGVKPGQIVGAIANEGNIESKYIGEISILIPLLPLTYQTVCQRTPCISCLRQEYVADL